MNDKVPCNWEIDNQLIKEKIFLIGESAPHDVAFSFSSPETHPTAMNQTDHVGKVARYGQFENECCCRLGNVKQ